MNRRPIVTTQSLSGGSFTGSTNPGSGGSGGRYGTFFLGRYRVVDEIGIGGMASVHLARADGPGGFQKWVAIKRIHPHLVEDDQFVHMFLDEARIAARISHANVAQVFELGEGDGTYWIAMEYLHGEPLREVMRCVEDGAPRIGYHLAAKIVADAAEGLHAAHDLRDKNGALLGLVHRDVTPHNLFVTYEGTVKVVDFGIAKVAGRLSSTRAGTLKGKLAYMSPEQVRGEEIDRRTDIFALGVVLWELTTGHRLFRMDSDLETLEKVQACIVAPPSSIWPDYPVELESIVMKALSRSADHRFQTARDFSRALQQHLMRRGLIVGPEDVSSYVRTIFADRMRQRDEHLRWAAEVTQTLSVDEFHGSMSSGASNEDISLHSYASEVLPAMPAAGGVGASRSALTARPPARNEVNLPPVRPAAGAPATASARPPTMLGVGPGLPSFAPEMPQLSARPPSPLMSQNRFLLDDDEEQIATVVAPTASLISMPGNLRPSPSGTPSGMALGPPAPPVGSLAQPMAYAPPIAPAPSPPEGQLYARNSAPPPGPSSMPPAGPVYQGSPTGPIYGAPPGQTYQGSPTGQVYQGSPTGPIYQGQHVAAGYGPEVVYGVGGSAPNRADPTMQVAAVRATPVAVYVMLGAAALLATVGVTAIVAVKMTAPAAAGPSEGAAPLVATGAKTATGPTGAGSTAPTATTAAVASAPSPAPSTSATTPTAVASATATATSTADKGTVPTISLGSLPAEKSEPAKGGGEAPKSPPPATGGGEAPKSPPPATGGGGAEKKKDEPAAGGTGFLTVVCSPFCDSVTVKGRSLGPSPVLKSPLPAGSYTVTLKASGSPAKSVGVTITAGQTTPLRVSMNLVNNSIPITRAPPPSHDSSIVHEALAQVFSAAALVGGPHGGRGVDTQLHEDRVDRVVPRRPRRAARVFGVGRARGVCRRVPVG